MKRVRLLPIWILVALTAVFTAVACGVDEVAIPQAAITANDFSFSGPARVDGGLTRVSLTNAGQEDHHVQMLRLNDGVSQAELANTIQEALEALPTEGEAAFLRIFGVSTLAGGPSIAGPGGKVSTVLNLQPGEYALLCFIASPSDGVPHVAKGMNQPLTVGALAEKQPEEPESSVAVALNDFAFSGLPASLSAGESTIKVTNSGTEPHEMVLAKLKGVTAEELRAALLASAEGPPPGPPPFDFVGGIQGIMPGQEGWVTVDLAAGDYAALCFIPSAAQGGAPHFALGMFTGFSVE